MHLQPSSVATTQVIDYQPGTQILYWIGRQEIPHIYGEHIQY